MLPNSMPENPILKAREQRWLRRHALALHHDAPVLTLCLNIPGSQKNLPGTDRAFARLLQNLRESIAAVSSTKVLVTYEESGLNEDGPFCHIVCSLPAGSLKQLAVEMENTHPLGRLADADVMDAKGNAVSRVHMGLPPRTCFLCHELPAVCRRAQHHSPQEIMDFVHKLLDC